MVGSELPEQSGGRTPAGHSWRSARLAIVLACAIASLLICAGPASARTLEGEISEASGGMVSYRQEGGIGGPRPSLIVSRDRRARVTLGGCTTKFALRPRAWDSLRAALRGAHLHAIAGDYPPPKGAADEITYVIEAGQDTVRIAPAPQPENEEAMRDLRPLLKALNKAVSAGKRRMRPSCKGNRSRAR
jgi:hypothetical protein